MNTRIWAVGLAFLMVCLTHASARATDQDTLAKLVAKTAPLDTDLATKFKPKSACVCPSVNQGMTGVLTTHSADNHVYCGLPVFNPDGSFLEFNVLCSPGTYFVLGH